MQSVIYCGPKLEGVDLVERWQEPRLDAKGKPVLNDAGEPVFDTIDTMRIVHCPQGEPVEVADGIVPHLLLQADNWTRGKAAKAEEAKS